MAKKNYIIDTSVFLTDADALFAFENNDVFIPLKVLEEIDKHKKRQDSVGFHARKIIKHLDGLRAKGSLIKGIRPEKGKGIIKVCDHDFQGIAKSSLDLRVPDHIILSAALKVQLDWDKRKTIVVSRDPDPYNWLSLTSVITPILSDLAISAASISAISNDN